VQWAELSTPRELLQAAADESGCKIEALEQIPHDLWPGANLPSLTLPERLTLILAGFDCTYELSDNGRTLRVTALPDRPTLQREYVLRADVSRNLPELSRRLPNAVVERTGTKLVVTGSAEDQDAVSRFLRGEPERRVPTGPVETRYTMEVENQPLGAVLRTLKLKAQLQISVDENAQDKLRELVSFDVKEVTLEQLLRTAMQNTGLAFQLKGLQLSVTLAQKP
jgi:hypothetical protein